MTSDTAIHHRLRVGGSRFKRLDSLRWTWYSNIGSVNEIDHVPVDGRWTLLQNFLLFCSTVLQCLSHAPTYSIYATSYATTKAVSYEILLSKGALGGARSEA